MEKTCFKCGESKPRSEFYRHPEMSDGLLGKCKECAKRDVKANRLRRYGYYREYDRGRAMLPHRVERRRRYSTSYRGRAIERKCKQRWIRRNPEKRKAHHALNNAIRDGKIMRQPCEVCGDVNSHGHHFDYQRPLEVRWLCAEHHHAEHKALAEAA